MDLRALADFDPIAVHGAFGKASRLEITAEDRPVDLVEAGYDLAIRADPPSDADLIARRFLRGEPLGAR